MMDDSGGRSRAEKRKREKKVKVSKQAVGGYEELTNDRVTTATGIRELWDDSSAFDLDKGRDVHRRAEEEVIRQKKRQIAKAKQRKKNSIDRKSVV